MKAEESLSRHLRSGCPSRSAAVDRFAAGPVTRVEIARGPVREYFVTFRPGVKLGGSMETAEDLYGRIAEFLAGAGAEIVQERCYADPAAYAEVAAARAGAFERRKIDGEGALCFVGEAPCEGSAAIAGVQLWAARGEDGKPRVTPLIADGRPVGRRFRGESLCYAAFSCVGPRPELGPDRPRGEHALSMFSEAGRLLEGAGLGYRDVIRTWIYVPELLGWYDEFNAARRRVFSEVGLIGGAGASWLPASTGIQGRCPAGRACTMGVLAASRANGASARVEMVASPGQCEAFDYGSAFSRAVEVCDDRSSRMYVSGTASIDAGGSSVHAGDAERQTAHTLDVIRELLAARGHTFADVAHLTAFIKGPEHLEGFRRAAAREGLDSRLAVETVADVCRPELLVEIEAMSVRAAPSAADERRAARR